MPSSGQRKAPCKARQGSTGGLLGEKRSVRIPAAPATTRNTGVRCFAVSGTRGPMQGIAGNEAEKEGGGERMHI